MVFLFCNGGKSKRGNVVVGAPSVTREAARRRHVVRSLEESGGPWQPRLPRPAPPSHFCSSWFPLNLHQPKKWRWSKPFWDPILGVGEFTQFRTYFSGWIGMFTGTIWVLTHGQMDVLSSRRPSPVSGRQDIVGESVGSASLGVPADILLSSLEPKIIKFGALLSCGWTGNCKNQDCQLPGHKRRRKGGLAPRQFPTSQPYGGCPEICIQLAPRIQVASTTACKIYPVYGPWALTEKLTLPMRL